MRVSEGWMRPLPFLIPTLSISISLSIVVPPIGNFSNFSYPLIFIRFKGFLGIGELPNWPTPFMDVCANAFFHPDLEGGWGHWTYLSSYTTTIIVVTVVTASVQCQGVTTVRSVQHLLNAIYRRQYVTVAITVSSEHLVEKWCDWHQTMCVPPYFIANWFLCFLFWWNISVCWFWLVWHRVLCLIVTNARQCCGSVMNDGVAHITLDYSALGRSIHYGTAYAIVRIVGHTMSLRSQERKQY